jgi:hypothetical protein
VKMRLGNEPHLYVRNDVSMKAGSIEFSEHTIDCLIRNQSETGAVLQLVSAIELPAQLKLVVASDRIRCRVIWRMGRVIGVKFLI